MKDYRLRQSPKEDNSDAQRALIDEIEAQINALDETGRLEVKNRLDAILGVKVGSLNLGEELNFMYLQGRALLNTVMGDKAVPANQRSQVFNTIQKQLLDIADASNKVFSQERLKRYEKAFLKVLEQCATDEQKEIFFQLYGEFLANDGGTLEEQ